MKMISLIVLVLYTAVSCSRNIDTELIASIKKQTGTKEKGCGVSFEKTFSLNWDKLYIFDSMLYPDEISEKLGVKYEGDIVYDGERLIIFLLNNEIVRDYESRFFNVNFVGVRKDGYIEIEKNESFCVKTKLLNGIKHYYLFPENH